MDAAADLQSDVEQLDTDVAQLDVAALKQSFVDLTRLGNSEQQGRGAKADAQRWKEVFGSDTAWSKCSAAAATPPYLQGGWVGVVLGKLLETPCKSHMNWNSMSEGIYSQFATV